MKLNVINIDFSYFATVEPEVVENYYPERKDSEANLSEALWVPKYCKKGKSYPIIKTIKNNNRFLNLAKKIIAAQKWNTFCVVSDTNVSILDTLAPMPNGINFDIDHLSYYTDTFDKYHPNPDFTESNPTSNNWIASLLEDRPSSNVIWYTRKEAVNLDDNKDVSLFKKTVTNSLKDLLNKEYDIVFLCRNDIATPPHLDTDFAELADACDKQFMQVSQIGAQEPRDLKAIKNNAKLFQNNVGLYITKNAGNNADK